MKVYINCAFCTATVIRHKKYYLKGLLAGSKFYCNTICQGLGRAKYYEDTFLDRFKEKIVKNSGPGGDCWDWVGYRDIQGYGMIYRKDRNFRASHISLELLKLCPRPSDAYVACHTCDNPPCVNPEHLWWGTMRENTQDMIAKNRTNHKIPYEPAPREMFNRKLDLTNLKFGQLTYIKEVGKTNQGALVWQAICGCGNLSKVPVDQVAHRKMCLECSINRFKNETPDLVGKQFGELTVICKLGYLTSKSKDIYWNCICSCGSHLVTRTNRLLNEEKTSCKNCKGVMSPPC